MKIKFKISLPILFLLVFCFSANTWALSFVIGSYKFVLDGVSRFEDPVPPNADPNYTVPESGNLWGVAQVQAIFKDSGGGLYDIAYWSKGANSEYLTMRFGGLDLTYDNSAFGPYHVTDAFGNAVPSIALPHQSYFSNENQTTGANETGSNVGTSYAQVYLSNTDPYASDVFGVGAVAGGDGVLGTFGTNMAAGTLVLDMAFAMGGLYVDEMTNGGFSAAYLTEVFRALITGNTRNETLGYLDVIGGAWLSTFNSNGWYANSPYLAALGRTDGFDVRLEASNGSAIPSPLSPEMAAAGWNARLESGSALTAAIPEPTTLLLIGIGLLGLTGISRKKLS